MSVQQVEGQPGQADPERDGDASRDQETKSERQDPRAFRPGKRQPASGR